MKTALLAEDEPTTLRFYQTGMKGLQGWRFLGAENGRKALEILRREAVDVLVTDLNMPVLDGYALIAAVHAHYPALPVIVLTSLPEGESLNRARQLGAIKVLSKPVRLSALMEEIRTLGERVSDGHIRGLNVGSLLQLMNWERKTSTLTVKSPEGVGLLYIREGQLIQATSPDHEGLEAAYQILGWSEPEVEFVETCRVEATIQMPVPEILMNAALALDSQRMEARKPKDDPWSMVD